MSHPIWLQPTVHVRSLLASIEFYEALGAVVVAGSRIGNFVRLDIGGCQLSLDEDAPDTVRSEGAVSLNFETDDLDSRFRELVVAGKLAVTAPRRVEFGRQIELTTPDGTAVTITQFTHPTS
ncbi:VOC family protein [Naasia lichenicola]|uniref:VOC domain-containing protein n=1 Tax=Naasia lichenicola TaxID=2565933 RepID=A0A4V3WT97_9MICO|nr:VOC family protein [Naasia lichenicola]THG31007.1 hypothetical protein E6C64_10420 [Naasia lichenicola]